MNGCLIRGMLFLMAELIRMFHYILLIKEMFIGMIFGNIFGIKVIFNFFRSDRWVWHGSASNGLRNPGAFCDGWRTDDTSHYGMASLLNSAQPLTHSPIEAGCNRRFVVLCIEVKLT